MISDFKIEEKRAVYFRTKVGSEGTFTVPTKHPKTDTPELDLFSEIGLRGWDVRGGVSSKLKKIVPNFPKLATHFPKHFSCSKMARASGVITCG